MAVDNYRFIFFIDYITIMSFIIHNLSCNFMRLFFTVAKKFAASARKVRHINYILFCLILLLTGMAIGHTSVPKFVKEVWAAAIGGIGTVGKVAAFSGTDTIGDSVISQDSPTSVTIGVVGSTQVGLTVTGDALLKKSLNIGTTLFVRDISTSGGALTINGEMTATSNSTRSSITTQTTDLYLGAQFPYNVRITGNKLYFNGSPLASTNGRSSTLTAAIKNFVIDHPLKPGYDLAHSSLEGPEIGVFYRGSGRLRGGRATVTLPNYFDALTRDHTATVLLTAKGETPFPLSYDEFNEKSFVAHGAKADGEFDWEVKATRADVPALEIERKK